MSNPPTRLVVLAALVLVGCPDSDDPLQASATDISGSSTSTTGPGETQPSEGDDTDTSSSTGSTSEATTLDTTGGTATSSEQFCGDGIQDADEQCDDGSQNSLNGPCALDCTLTCGDGKIQEGEECDLGTLNENTSSCTKGCKNARCGDNFIQPGETCDDGDLKNSLDPDKCNPVTCTPNLGTCGNNELNPGEECDPSAPGMDTTSCTTSCTFVSRIIFATPGIHKGDFSELEFGDMNLSGLDSADLHCQSLAESANLDHAGSFIALLSTPEQPISQRLSAFSGEYADTTPTRITIGNDDLLNGVLQAPITRDHLGQNAMADNTFVWTGSLNTGASSQATCNAWEPASPLDRGLVGKLGEANSSWLNHQESPCSLPAHLYCVQNGN